MLFRSPFPMTTFSSVSGEELYEMLRIGVMACELREVSSAKSRRNGTHGSSSACADLLEAARNDLGKGDDATLNLVPERRGDLNDGLGRDGGEDGGRGGDDELGDGRGVLASGDAEEVGG